MDDGDEFQEVTAGRVPIVRKHYTPFNGLQNNIHDALFVHNLHHPGKINKLLQPHMSQLRYST